MARSGAIGRRWCGLFGMEGWGCGLLAGVLG